MRFSLRIVPLVWMTVLGFAQPASADGWSEMRDGVVVLFRHANAPGVGDPAGFDVADCRTQRNLDDAGRKQARRIGEAFRRRSIKVGTVLTSQWCRARETANLAFPGQAREAAEFNSFFDRSEQGRERTEQAWLRLAQWRGPGVMVVTTHQVNIAALTGISPASGEGIVVRIDGSDLNVLGRLRFTE